MAGSERIKGIIDDLDLINGVTVNHAMGRRMGLSKVEARHRAYRAVGCSTAILELVSQWLQESGYEDASKAIDCEFDL